MTRSNNRYNAGIWPPLAIIRGTLAATYGTLAIFPDERLKDSRERQKAPPYRASIAAGDDGGGAFASRAMGECKG